MDLAEVLIRRGACTREQVDEVRLQIEPFRDERDLGSALAEAGWVDEETLARAFAESLDLGFEEDLESRAVPQDLVRRVPIDYARRRLLLPVGRSSERVLVAMADPLDTAAVDDAGMLLSERLEIVVAAPSAIRQAINRFYYETAGAAPEETASTDAAVDLVEGGSKDLLRRTGEGPVVEIVDRILLRAVRARASDIHVEPYDADLRLRFRVDGMLLEQAAPPVSMQAALVSRIKIMADLDIAEQRLPQDGKARIRIGDRELDIRVSTVPTSYGERVVLRLLDPASMLYSLEALGMPADILEDVESILGMSHGLLLVTGPTGSGKTTTLYSALQRIHDRRRNIMTIEEPVEYQMKGVGQIEARPQIGLTFAQGLRHVLRQDPDVILIGEMRDLETAEIAVRASLTGHQVLSTLHTNDAVTAVTRLVDMGVEPYLVAACLVGVLAQRLVRCVCPACSEPDDVEPAMAQALGVSVADLEAMGPRRGTGCSQCGDTGYFGRVGLFEMLRFDRDVRKTVHGGWNEEELLLLVRQRGLRTLRQDGLEKVKGGSTTLAEVVRVTMRDQE